MLSITPNFFRATSPVQIYRSFPVEKRLHFAGAPTPTIDLEAKANPEWTKTANNTHRVLEARLRQGHEITAEDTALIQRLQEVLGSPPITVKAPNQSNGSVHADGMTFDSGLLINKEGKLTANLDELNKPGNLEKVVKALRVLQDATAYRKHVKFIYYRRADGSIHPIAVNNRDIHRLLLPALSSDHPPSLSSTQFSKMFELLKKKKVFELEFTEGIPPVTIKAGTEGMKRRWPADTCGMMALIEAKDPYEVVKGLSTFAKGYCSDDEIKAFERVIRDPGDYKENLGVAHVFYQEGAILSRDSTWTKNQRLESHGLILRAFADKVRNGLTGEDETGFPNEASIPPEVIASIVRFTHYLLRLGPNSQTSGPWEEIPFKEGANYDTACCIQGLASVKALIQLLNDYPNLGNRFKKAENKLLDKTGLNPEDAVFNGNTDLIDAYTNEGRNTIIKHYLQEFRGLTKRVDSASVMLTASGFKFNIDPVRDAEMKIDILEQFQNILLGPYGARRYNQHKTKIDEVDIKLNDSYLKASFGTVLSNETDGLHLNKEGIEKAYRQAITNENRWPGKAFDNSSDPQRVLARGVDSEEATSAQWGLPVTYAALSYALMVQTFIEQYDKNRGLLNDKEQRLFQKAFNGATEHIVRAYGTITGSKPDGSAYSKANGDDSEPWIKPEAYQAVPTLIPDKNAPGRKEKTFVPGINSSLNWDAGKLYEASVLYLSILEQLEIRPDLARLTSVS